MKLDSNQTMMRLYGPMHFRLYYCKKLGTLCWYNFTYSDVEYRTFNCVDAFLEEVKQWFNKWDNKTYYLVAAIQMLVQHKEQTKCDDLDSWRFEIEKRKEELENDKTVPNN